MAGFKKKTREKYEYIDPELEQMAHFDRDKDDMFESIETLQYVRTKCQIITESGAYINELKKEASVVENYLSDVRIMSSQSDKMERKLSGIAREVLSIREKREKIRKAPSRLKHSQYNMLEKYNSSFPKALYDFQNDEKYASVVKHDLNMLEAEKMSLKEDIENFGYKRTNIRNIAVISLLGIIVVFAILFGTGQTKTDNGMTLFMIVMFLVAVYVALIFIMLRRGMYSFKLAEKKLKRAVTLLNRTKIKYVNVVNSVNYQKEKYGVKNSLELGKIYEIYLEESSRNDKYLEQSEALMDAEGMFEDVISTLGLYDASVWSAQLEAVADKREMRELEDSLNRRKLNLREQIDYNLVRIDSAREEITNVLRKHPELKKEILEIVDSYDNT